MAADIHLRQKQDPAAYVQCYSQLAEQHGDYESYRLLGLALLRIQEPEKAIKAMLHSSCIRKRVMFDMAVAASVHVAMTQ